MSDDVQSVSMRNEIGGCFQVAKLSNITSEAMGFLLPRVLNVPRFATKDIFRFPPSRFAIFVFLTCFFVLFLFFDGFCSNNSRVVNCYFRVGLPSKLLACSERPSSFQIKRISILKIGWRCVRPTHNGQLDWAIRSACSKGMNGLPAGCNAGVFQKRLPEMVISITLKFLGRRAALWLIMDFIEKSCGFWILRMDSWWAQPLNPSACLSPLPLPTLASWNEWHKRMSVSHNPKLNVSPTKP